MNWIFCWLPFDSCSARRSARSSARNRRSQSSASAPGAVGRHAVEAGEELELLEDAHPRVQAALLGQVAPGRAREAVALDAAPGDPAGVGLEHAERDPHRRRLAGAVGAEEAEHLALPGPRTRGRRARRRCRSAWTGGRRRGSWACQGRHASPSIAGTIARAIRGRSCSRRAMMVRVAGSDRVRLDLRRCRLWTCARSSSRCSRGRRSGSRSCLGCCGRAAPACASWSRVVPDLLRLLRDLVGDRTTPLDVRVVIVVLVAWIVSPIDLIPEFIPVLGPFDDVVVASSRCATSVDGSGRAGAARPVAGQPRGVRRPGPGHRSLSARRYDR